MRHRHQEHILLSPRQEEEEDGEKEKGDDVVCLRSSSVCAIEV